MQQDVMITCPTTHQPLFTGVQLSEAVFATAVFTNVKVLCQHCEQEHRWSKADAFLVETTREAAAERASAPPRFVRRGRPPSQGSAGDATTTATTAAVEQVAATDGA
jgi:hypothetical protein